MKQSVFWIALFLITGLFSCKEGDEIISIDEPISFPSDFPRIEYSNEETPFTKDRILLGRHLFYDNDLSEDHRISCGSCHAQVHGFADHNTPKSFGIHGRLGKRNAPAIVNVAWMKNFMWDGGIRNLDVMSIAPLTDSNEMGLTLKDVVRRVSQKDKYRQLFKNAYGSDSIDEYRILVSLSQFMLQLISDNSKYDRVKRGQATFNSDEKAGYELFKGNCGNCHQEPLFTHHQFERNGVVHNQDDPGRYRITQLEEDRGKFKVPTLRNIELTYPYMHDGSILTLTDVIQGYNNVDRNLNPNVPNFHLDSIETNQIMAFLKTLTDYTFISKYEFAEIP